MLKLAPARFEAVQPPGGTRIEEHTSEAEIADLNAGLKKERTAKDTASGIIAAHRASREKLQKYLAQVTAWDNSRPWVWDDKGGHQGEPKLSPPTFPDIQIGDGLPAEFADYLEGALAWHNPLVADKSAAREAWERLLARPSDQRRYKSTWAAFMMGKSWAEAGNAEKAFASFQLVRTLASQGFADSTGLAAASLGLEAKLRLERKEFAQAIDLYLEQLATGDDTAPESLRIAAENALESAPATLQTLALNPRAQRVITAYLVSLGEAYNYEANPDGEPVRISRRPSTVWLAALEAAGVKDADLVEKLALAAYQNNDMAGAERWIKRGPNSPTAQWIQAKLFLRQGDLAKAASQLAKAAQHFPIQPPVPYGSPSDEDFGPKISEFKDCLSYASISVDRQVLGELGVLKLARREYTGALDALLTAGFWKDAAYVAERVLTIDELKAYVDRRWQNVSAEQAAAEREQYGESELSPLASRKQIRYLLARRLMRSLRGDEAREYYPPQKVVQYDQLANALRAGWDQSAAAADRARALFEAAIITRTNGMELLGTELGPDGAIYEGDHEVGALWQDRTTNAPTSMVGATTDEIRRAANHGPDPDQRFHYRYQAAFLGWEAAKLMPNNSEETARVLCISGSWLKGRDPETADIFYKALVRRNRHTEIGQEADRIRWFPTLDGSGNVFPRKEDLPAGKLFPEETGGYRYILHKGDSLAAVVIACANAGINVTVADLVQANPGVDPARLLVGQVIKVPMDPAVIDPGSESVASAEMEETE